LAASALRPLRNHNVHFSDPQERKKKEKEEGGQETERLLSWSGLFGTWLLVVSFCFWREGREGKGGGRRRVRQATNAPRELHEQLRSFFAKGGREKGGTRGPSRCLISLSCKSDSGMWRHISFRSGFHSDSIAQQIRLVLGKGNGRRGEGEGK